HTFSILIPNTVAVLPPKLPIEISTRLSRELDIEFRKNQSNSGMLLLRNFERTQPLSITVCYLQMNMLLSIRYLVYNIISFSNSVPRIFPKGMYHTRSCGSHLPLADLASSRRVVSLKPMRTGTNMFSLYR
ncbi:MAG: hypothetical protein OEW15_18410, partial [Nitrospirota bacterium]|nr:hypothetical protein [Nitrospirota bacterium]